MFVSVPSEWPVGSRDHVAVAKLQVVDQRDDTVLVCDCLHDGPHFWPDDEPAAPIWDDELDASLADVPERDEQQPVPTGDAGESPASGAA